MAQHSEAKKDTAESRKKLLKKQQIHYICALVRQIVYQQS